MDIKEKIEDLVEKIKGDKDLLANFKKAPIPTVEKLLGIDLPDDKLEALVDGIKAKLDLDKLDDMLDGIGDKLGGLKGLFGK